MTDTLGKERISINVSFAEQLYWVNRKLQIDGQDYGNIDPNKLLIETYGRDDIAGKLLILGAPGAGKTTAMLSLAEQLICGALKNPKTVIPVIFELSTWRDDNQSIEKWLIEQLYELHGGNRKHKIYESWLEQQVLLPLLDGLDELGLERQKKCTFKLNEFAQHYPHIIVCCRLKEFEAVNLKLKTLRGAVCLQPLSDEQIQNYLDDLNRSELWSVIQKNDDFRKLLEPTPEGEPGLLRVPLFVKLVVDVYDPQKPITSKADLLEKYIDRQLLKDTREQDRRKETEKGKWAYKTVEDEPHWRKTRKTLSWIARTLEENYETEFLIEKMQPYYLNNKLHQWQYWLILFMANILISGTIIRMFIWRYILEDEQYLLSFFPISILILGLFGGLILSTESKKDGLRLIIYPIVQVFCLIFNKEIPIEFRKYLPILHDIDLYYKFRLKIPSIIDLKYKIFTPTFKVANLMSDLISIPLLYIMILLYKLSVKSFLTIGLKKIGSNLNDSFDTFFAPAKLNNLYLEALDESRHNEYEEHKSILVLIQYVQMIKQKAGLLFNSIFIFITFSPTFILSVIILVTSFICISVSEEIKESSTPNQGLQEGLKAALLISILLYVFSFITFQTFQNETISYRIISCILGFLACSIYLPLVKHLCLRLVLWQSGIPWNLARFLNYCVERRLLLRVGGRYRFLHRELLDHFAQSSNT